MMKFMYDVIDKESKVVIKKDAVQKIKAEGMRKAEGMSEEAAIESIKFFCCGPYEEVINVRIA